MSDDQVNEWIKTLRVERDSARIEVARLRDELQARRDAAAIEQGIIDAERALADDLADALDDAVIALLDPRPADIAKAERVLARWRGARGR